MENTIFYDRIFYHIYPLGLCNCPKSNDFKCERGFCFEKMEEDLDRIKKIGFNAIYIGPVFESSRHGYDTVDYFHVDRRLGNNQSFAHYCKTCHDKGISVILDAVFNHTGRDFFAFKDIQQNGENSVYKNWYLNLNFSRKSEYNDSFDYDGWAGCKDLVKLNLLNPEVEKHIFDAIKFWKEEFNIDGLRLDAADVLPKKFLKDLNAFCKSNFGLDFYLMGEVVHGDYNDWINPECIDSVTNYQISTTLISAINSKNFYELSYNLEREFGKNGLYTYSLLYNFVDNHDVNRAASVLKENRFLYLLYGLLFTIPGTPSVFYGSEYGILGERGKDNDFMLRPPLPPFVPEIPDFAKSKINGQNLCDAISNFIYIRQNNKVLQLGNLEILDVDNKKLAFKRIFENQEAICLFNIDDDSVWFKLNVNGGKYFDAVDKKEFYADDLKGIEVFSGAVRILIKQN